jgi:dipeptidyl aminopeptidase/acylaminoacyl peptidase
MNPMRPIVVLAGMISLAAATPALATSPGPNGRIFFSARPALSTSSGCGIASVRPDGTGYNCIDPFGRDPAVSPDHRHIVSVRGEEHVEVYGSDISGKGVKRLTRAPGAFPNSLAPSFSPDSRRTLWFEYGGAEGVDGLYLMNADGTGQHQLTGDGGQDPVFSPSGAQIAYTRGGLSIANADGSGSHVVVADQNTTSQETLSRYFERNGEASWAPDGRRLAFARHTSTTTFQCTPIPSCAKPVLADDVYAMNPDGTGVRQLTSTPNVDEVDPSYSPDGRLIAYYRRAQGADDIEGEIWVMNADGSGQKRAALGANPEWSSLLGGPKRPVISLRLHRLNRRRTCLGRLDGWSVRVKTSALRYTGFNIHFLVDGRTLDEEFNTRSMSDGIDAVFPRRKRHRLKVVVDDPAVHDRISRTYTLRRC